MTEAFDARLALRATGALREFNETGVLTAADVHVAQRVCALGGETDELVMLAIAFAVRGPRLGHVFVDLATVAETASVESEEAVDLTELPWPPADDWLARVAASVLVAAGEDDGHPRPLRLLDSGLYLDRYWREERQVARDLVALAVPRDNVRLDVLSDGIGRVFRESGDAQKLVGATAVLRRFVVVAGGPGTGKTTTVARIAALLCEQAAGGSPPLIALAAPTGKAAARLAEAVHAEAGGLDVSSSVREVLLDLDACTLHRLLGWRPGSHSRFRHHRGNRLPHDVVIVDETSMVGLSMMARIVEAVRPGAQLILVGDPAQLTSIEAGAVLGDIVGPAAEGLVLSAEAKAALEAATGSEVVADTAPVGTSVGDGIVVLDRVYRHGGVIAALAAAVRAGDADGVIELLGSGADDVTWLAADVAGGSADQVRPLRDGAVAAARAVMEAAAAGDARAAIDALGAFRVLCAHRRGDHGAATWIARIEQWLGEEVPEFATGGRWYVGRPLLVTENDYSLRLFNGDTGVVVAAGPDRVAAAFERRDDVVTFSPTRLAAVDTVYAMTIHKSQGSQFGTAAVVLPGPDSPILTRELLYTAVTRAQDRLVLAGTEETVRLAVERPIARASGLRRWLWDGSSRTS
jgi:exodeoxyribonuclease V alpha subunit